METKRNNGVRFSADVKISEKGIGKDVNIDIRYIDLTNPIEWDQLQKWLIKLRRTLEVTFGNEETLDWYCNSEHEPRRSWDMQTGSRYVDRLFSDMTERVENASGNWITDSVSHDEVLSKGISPEQYHRMVCRGQIGVVLKGKESTPTLVDKDSPLFKHQDK